MDVAREYYRGFEERLKQSGVELSNKSFDEVMNQIHSSEQESPFYAEWHDGGSGINSSPISFVDSDHGRNYLVDLPYNALIKYTNAIRMRNAVIELF